MPIKLTSPLSMEQDIDKIKGISEALRPRTQSAGGVTALEIHMRQSQPPCSRKSAVPEGTFGSLASSDRAQPTENYPVSDIAKAWLQAGHEFVANVGDEELLDSMVDLVGPIVEVWRAEARMMRANTD